MEAINIIRELRSVSSPVGLVTKRCSRQTRCQSSPVRPLQQTATISFKDLRTCSPSDRLHVNPQQILRSKIHGEMVLQTALPA